jgi:hypothetical protein
MIRKTNAGNRRLPCRLTEDEKQQKTRELPGCIGDLKDLDSRLDDAKAIVKHLDKDRKAEAGRRDGIARIILDGQEERSVEFDQVLDYDNERVIEIRSDTQEVIGVRDMRETETQREMPFVGESVQGPEDLNEAVVHFFNRQGRAERLSVGGSKDEDGSDPAARLKRAIFDEPGVSFALVEVDDDTAALWALVHTGEVSLVAEHGGGEFARADSPDLTLDVMAMLANQPELGTEEGLPQGEIEVIRIDEDETVAELFDLALDEVSGDALKALYLEVVGKKPGRLGMAKMRIAILEARVDAATGDEPEVEPQPVED